MLRKSRTPPTTFAKVNAADVSPELLMSLNSLNARIAGLKRDQENMKSDATALNCQAEDNQHASIYMPTATAISTSELTSRAMSLPPPQDQPGPTSLCEPIKILQQKISEKNNADEHVSFVREPCPRPRSTFGMVVFPLWSPFGRQNVTKGFSGQLRQTQ